MPFLVVGVISILVGAAVYVATVRGEDESPQSMGFGEGAEGSAATSGALPPGYTYLRLSTEGPAPRERVQGLFGLVLLICVGAAALALALYEMGHLINRTIEAFLAT